MDAKSYIPKLIGETELYKDRNYEMEEEDLWNLVELVVDIICWCSPLASTERERERENGLVPPIGMKLDKKKKKICSLKVTCCDIRLDCLCVLWDVMYLECMYNMT
jgi:hypothetical protein